MYEYMQEDHQKISSCKVLSNMCAISYYKRPKIFWAVAVMFL